MPNMSLLGTLKRVLPNTLRDGDMTLTSHVQRTLINGARAVRGAVEMYAPCVELDMARLSLIEAEMWIHRAEAVNKGDR